MEYQNLEPKPNTFITSKFWVLRNPNFCSMRSSLYYFSLYYSSLYLF